MYGYVVITVVFLLVNYMSKSHIAECNALHDKQIAALKSWHGDTQDLPEYRWATGVTNKKAVAYEIAKNNYDSTCK